ncbi:hypothetical protein MKW98_000293 [Papaver atlanticum]|uniref:CS domain-containing protein n=1 Tax=Papaver atlanticum TaxID=357466 RepID=A0AAD4S1T8_9MAGN|nr:hypothetical protein MKW98_000293 [Papaver atlanticum]
MASTSGGGPGGGQPKSSDQVKWAQREDKVYLTVLLPDAKDAKVNVEESKLNVGVRSIVCYRESRERVVEESVTW